MTQIQVIGVGSDFGADQVGQRVIELLRQKIVSTDLNDNVSINYFDRPGIYLIEFIKDQKTVHLIDAIKSNHPIGTLYQLQDIEAISLHSKPLSSHGVGVAEVLRLADVLQCLPEKIIIHGIEIGEGDPPDMNFPIMVAAIHKLVDRILRELSNEFIY